MADPESGHLKTNVHSRQKRIERSDNRTPFGAPLTSVKIPLAGAALATYNSERGQLIAGNYLISFACSTYFGAGPTRAPFFNQLVGAVNSQVPYDGAQTNISQYDAGFSDGKNPFDVSIKKKIPVCALFVPFHGPNGTVNPGLVTAASQISRQAGVVATDAYINTNPKALASLTQATILHEVLHNLTGLLDFVPLNWRNLYGYQPPYDLKTFVGIEIIPGIDPNYKTTNDITIQLRSNGCAGTK